ncbi:MAG: putative Ig domain-containing protein [Candidatus Omnitrophota bacterium]
MNNSQKYKVLIAFIISIHFLGVSAFAANDNAPEFIFPIQVDFPYSSYPTVYGTPGQTVSFDMTARDVESGDITSQIILIPPEGVNDALFSNGHFEWTVPAMEGRTNFVFEVGDNDATNPKRTRKTVVIEANSAVSALSNLAPLPRQLEEKEFELTLNNDSWKIVTDTDIVENFNTAQWLHDRILIRTAGRINLTILDDDNIDQLGVNDKAIYLGVLEENPVGFMREVCLRRNVSLPTFKEFKSQGYVLETFNDGLRQEIVIVAKENAGVFYGATTLSEMVSANGSLLGVKILDFPHFEKRGNIPQWLCVIAERDRTRTPGINSNADWAATKKINYVAEMYPREMLYLYSGGSAGGYRIQQSQRFSSFIPHLQKRFMNYIPGIGQFKHHLEYNNWNPDYGVPYHLELAENYYSHNEPFQFESVLDPVYGNVEIAQPDVAYEDLAVSPSEEVHYGDFETDSDGNNKPDGWVADGINSPLRNMEWKWDSQEHYSGSRSMKCELSSGASSSGPILEIQLTGGKVIPNSHYVATFWYKKQNLNASYLQFLMLSKTGSREDDNWNQFWTPSGASTDGWKKGYVLMKTRAASDKIILFARIQGAGGLPGAIWVDNVSIRRLDGAMLNVVRQPDFPQHDIVVRDSNDLDHSYIEGVDYEVLNGSIGTGYGAGGIFDPDFVMDSSQYEESSTASAAWWHRRGGAIQLQPHQAYDASRYDPTKPEVFPTNSLVPFRIRRIATGSIASGSQVLISYNAYYLRSPRWLGHKPLAFGDERHWNMDYEGPHPSLYYKDSFRGLFNTYVNEIGLPTPEFISILGDEDRGLGTDSRTINSMMSMQQLRARTMNNINTKVKEYSPGTTILTYSDIIDRYFTGGYSNDQVRHSGLYGRMAEVTEHELASKDMVLMHWSSHLFNTYSSIEYFAQKGYKSAPEIWISWEYPLIRKDLAQIIAGKKEDVVMPIAAMANYGNLAFPGEWDKDFADLFWNPRYATIFLNSFENYQNDNVEYFRDLEQNQPHQTDLTLLEWAPNGDMSYFVSGPGISNHPKVHDSQDQMFNRRSVGLKGSNSSVSLANERLITVTPGREYMLVGYVRPLDDNSEGARPIPPEKPIVSLAWYSLENNHISTNNFEVGNINVNNGFAKFEFPISSPIGARKVKIILHGAPNSYRYWYDNIQFKKSLSLDYNHPPEVVLNGIEGTQGEAINATVFTDADEDPLTVTSSVDLPAGASFTEDGVFHWPDPVMGIYDLSLSVTDGLFTQEALVSIAVNNPPEPPANNPPVLILPDALTGVAGEKITFQVTASDIDGDVVVVNSPNLPSGASFNGMIFEWIPSDKQIGNYDVQFMAYDSHGALAQGVVTIKVISRALEEPADLTPPVISNFLPERNARNVSPDTNIQMTLTDDDSGINTKKIVLKVNSVLISDKDYRCISNSAIPEDSEKSCDLSYDPSVNFSWDSGVMVNIEIEDNAGNQTTENYSFFISSQPSSDKTPPSVTNRVPGQGQKDVMRNTSISFILNDNDSGIDKNSILLKVNEISVDSSKYVCASNGAIPENPDRSCQVIYDPNVDFEYGQRVAVSIDAQDLAGNKMPTDIYSFETEQEPPPPVNHPPILNAPSNVEGLTEEKISFVVTASDIDAGDRVTITASNLPAGALFNGKDFEWTPGSKQNGTFRVQFTATDSRGATTQKETILKVDLRPYEEPLDVTAPIIDHLVPADNAENVEPSTFISAELHDADSGLDEASIKMIVDGQDVTQSLVLQPIDSSNDINGELVLKSASIKYQPVVEFNFAQKIEVLVIAVDKKGNRAEELFNFTIKNLPPSPPNHAPVVHVPVSPIYYRGTMIEFEVTASDEDNDPVAITADNLPQGASFGGTTFSWMPGTGQFGTFAVSFIARDPGNLTDTKTVTVIVLPPGTPIPPANPPGTPPDTTPPYISNRVPADGAVNVSPNTFITFDIFDASEGVNIDSVQLTVNGAVISRQQYNRNRNGRGYHISYDSAQDFSRGQRVTVYVRAQDHAGNIMTENYSFTIQRPTAFMEGAVAQVFEMFQGKVKSLERKKIIGNASPAEGNAANVDTDISFDIPENFGKRQEVDEDSIKLEINGEEIKSYDFRCAPQGDVYRITYEPGEDFKPGQLVKVGIQFNIKGKEDVLRDSFSFKIRSAEE